MRRTSIALRHFRRDLTIETKPDRTFVTEADTAIETMIRERLADAFPDHGIVGEEYGTSDADASGALVPRPDRRDPQLPAWHPALRHACSRSSATASSRRP